MEDKRVEIAREKYGRCSEGIAGIVFKRNIYGTT
jgi:hypothetical protein